MQKLSSADAFRISITGRGLSSSSKSNPLIGMGTIIRAVNHDNMWLFFFLLCLLLEIDHGIGIDGGRPSDFESNNARGARFATIVFASSFWISPGALPESHFSFRAFKSSSL